MEADGVSRSLVHLYCGEGKGKTTAAMGLALRMAGRGGRVLIAQFCKGADSGERRALAALAQVTLLPVPEQVPFTFCMTREQRESERVRYGTMLEEIRTRLREDPPALLVLDEICAALQEGFVALPAVLEILDLCCATEVVLTGREAPRELEERADYLTRMEQVRHPFQRGVGARAGIEY